MLIIKTKIRLLRHLLFLQKFLKGRRLITFGGVFADIKKQLKLNDVETGDLVNIEDEQKKIFKKLRKCYLNLTLKLVAIFAKQY